MKLKVVGSGSRGNAYILESESEILLLELGVRKKDIDNAINYQYEKVVGALVTHEHQDHSKSINNFINAGIKVYASKGTFDVLNIKPGYKSIAIKSGEAAKIGEFTVKAFDVVHDVKEPLGFLIQHKDMGKLVFITDTKYCKYKFKGLDHIMVEANYKKEYLENEAIKNRVINSHMEITQTIEFLKSNDNINLKNVILIHLSSVSSDLDEFRTDCMATVGKPVYVAKKGLELELIK